MKIKKIIIIICNKQICQNRSPKKMGSSGGKLLIGNCSIFPSANVVYLGLGRICSTCYVTRIVHIIHAIKIDRHKISKINLTFEREQNDDHFFHFMFCFVLFLFLFCFFVLFCIVFCFCFVFCFVLYCFLFLSFFFVCLFCFVLFFPFLSFAQRKFLPKSENFQK